MAGLTGTEMLLKVALSRWLNVDYWEELVAAVRIADDAAAAAAMDALAHKLHTREDQLAALEAKEGP